MPHFFSYYTILYGSAGSACLSMGIFVLLKNKRSKLNLLFFYFCFGIAVWMLTNCFVNTGVFDTRTSLWLTKIVFTSVVFLPTLALHFTIEFLGEVAPKRVRFDLKVAYALTLIFFILLWTTPHFITGLYTYKWGFYPRGGFIHVMHAIFVVATAVYVVSILWLGLKKIEMTLGKSKKYYETTLVFLGFLFATLSCVDFLQSWGFSFFPLGSICMTFFVTSITYGIFRHNLLGVSIAIKKSLAYSILISIISSLYFLCVYITSFYLGNFAKTNSISFIIFTITLLTFLFKPLEHKIHTAIDSIFFIRPRALIEEENERLMREVLKQDRLRAVATLATGMAHEIKNPLTSIKTFAEYLPKKYDDPEFREKFSRIVVDEVDRVNNIVKQLLEFSKPSELNLKPILVSNLLDETVSLLNNNLLRCNIRLVKNFDSYAMILADRNQLKQAFLNIFLNSIQSMPGGGQLEVVARKEASGQVKITVSDTGCGVAPEQLSHVFDPFYTTKEEGTGLGLAIVHGIIVKHGGKVWMESAAGKGTTVNVTLKSQS